MLRVLPDLLHKTSRARRNAAQIGRFGSSAVALTSDHTNRGGPMRCAPASPARTASWARPSIAKALKTAPMSHIVPASSRRDLLLSTTLLGAGMAAAAPSQASAAAAAAAAGGAPAAQAVGGVTRAELAGLSISQIIKGCWQLSGGHRGERESDRTSGAAAVEDFQKFVEAGITTFDTADIYGPSESLIGKYLAAHPEESGRVQVLTKFCCFGDSMRKAADFKYVEQCIDGSRQRLGVDRLDLVQFYWHDYNNKNYVRAAQHLAELQAQGKIRLVGVTNFDVPRMQEIMDAGVAIAANQVQYSLLDRRPEVAMVPFCQERGIKLLPYGATAGGFLSDKYLGADPGSVTINTYSKSKYGSVIGQAGGWEWLQELLHALSEVAAKHGVSIADVAQKWVLDKPTVAGVIVGARNAEHVADHQRVCGLALDAEDAAKIQAVLDRGIQPTSDCYTWERGGRW